MNCNKILNQNDWVGWCGVKRTDGTGYNCTERKQKVACFTPGTLIATPKGERPVERLGRGDKIITRDNGIQKIRWAGKKNLDPKTLILNPHLNPILIRKGSLDNDLPETDLMVSPNHRMLVRRNKSAVYYEETEVFAAAKHLINNRSIFAVDRIQVSYLHFMFDTHQIVLANGSWTESFQPSDHTLKAVGNAQRTEILELFPELATTEGIKDFHSGRETLTKAQARELAK